MAEQIATRQAYGKKLIELGEKNPNVVVLDADLSCSTQTGQFAASQPKRFFNVGVAEQDLMGTAAGLASTGKVVFASSFTMFATGRAWEVVRNSICYPFMNVKVCSTHAGITVGEDGASHQAIEDIALMRSIPDMRVFVPADAVETEQIIEAVADYNGPCYVRLGRAKSPVLFGDDYKFEMGKGNIIKQGSKVCLFATGYETHLALEAAKILETKGLDITVVNMASIKPIDQELIVKMAQTHDILFSVEEHNIMGGLGSAISEVLVEKEPKRLIRLGLNDEFGQSGSAEDLLKHYGIDAQGIALSILKHA